MHKCTLPVVTVAVKPQETWKAHGQRGEANGPNQGNQIVEDRDSLTEDKGNSTETDRAAHPSDPMNDSVGLQMTRVTQDTHKYVFSGDLNSKISSGSLICEGDTHMQVDRGAYDQS